MPETESYLAGAALIVVAAIALVWVVRRKATPAERGWQFFERPNKLEPPGTVFRIDEGGIRYVARTCPVPSSKGPEPSAKVAKTVRARMGLVASMLSLGRLDVAASTEETVRYKLEDPIRELTTDQDVDEALPACLGGITIRGGSRYFVIREVRHATGLTYRLTRNQVVKIGGEAQLRKLHGAGNVVHDAKSDELSIAQKFSETLGVMFLPEELHLAPGGEGGPSFKAAGAGPPSVKRTLVAEALVWKETRPEPKPDRAVVRTPVVGATLEV